MQTRASSRVAGQEGPGRSHRSLQNRKSPSLPRGLGSRRTPLGVGLSLWYSTLCRPPRSADLSNWRQSRPYHGRPPQKMLGSSRLLGISITRCCVRANKATRLLRICSTSAPGGACVVAGFERPRALHLHSRPRCLHDVPSILNSFSRV